MTTTVASPESPAFTPANMPRKGETITIPESPQVNPVEEEDPAPWLAAEAEPQGDDPEIAAERIAALEAQLVQERAAHKKELESLNARFAALEARIDDMTDSDDANDDGEVAPEAMTTKEKETKERSRVKVFGRKVLNVFSRATSAVTDAVREKAVAVKDTVRVKVSDAGAGVKAQTVKVTTSAKETLQKVADSSVGESVRRFATGGDAVQSTIEAINAREAKENGELTWEEYLAQRPKDGVVRTKGGGFYDTEAKKFTSRDAYNEQVGGDAQEYYDDVNGIDTNQGSRTAVRYGARGSDRLTQDAKDALDLGDMAAYRQINSVLEGRFADSPDAQQAYENEIDQHLQDNDAKELARNPEKTRFEKLKAFLANEGDKIRQFGGLAYIGNLFAKSQRGIITALDGRGDTRGEDTGEVQKKRLLNRRHLIMGAAGVGLVGIAFLMRGDTSALQHTADVATGFDPSTLGGTEHASSLDFTPFGSGDHSAHLLNADLPVHTVEAPSVDQVPADTSEVPGDPSMRWTPEDITTSEAISGSEYNVTQGMGGETLFGNLSLDKSVWYDHAQELAQKFPTDFYIDSDTGEVGINYNNGQLSQAAREYIQALRG